uniref:Uncharacterized protein n=1 Tax=Timema poppense TaxID=170557 RepID=A0A7R9HFD7_TIMPO|nr:unnamed protein product [Timema poppensis]
MEELQVQDLDFLHGCANPTIILIHQDLNGRHVKTHEIALRDKEFHKFHTPRSRYFCEAKL